jgi:hypothetical protein
MDEMNKKTDLKNTELGSVRASSPALYITSSLKMPTDGRHFVQRGHLHSNSNAKWQNARFTGIRVLTSFSQPHGIINALCSGTIR